MCLKGAQEEKERERERERYLLPWPAEQPDAARTALGELSSPNDSLKAEKVFFLCFQTTAATTTTTTTSISFNLETIIVSCCFGTGVVKPFKLSLHARILKRHKYVVVVVAGCKIDWLIFDFNA